jgi:4-aminobutyrate aminotransferase-like enzyme
MVDTDGNTVLDLNAAQSGLPIGYNADALVHLRMGNDLDRFVLNKVNSALPPTDMAELI